MSGQFRELLESVNNALRSGDSPENAFREGHREMVYQYGEYAPISRETARLVRGLDNQIPLEKLLEDFARRGGTEEIREFSEVFSIEKRGGGNMTEIPTTVLGANGVTDLTFVFSGQVEFDSWQFK